MRLEKYVKVLIRRYECRTGKAVRVELERKGGVVWRVGELCYAVSEC